METSGFQDQFVTDAVVQEELVEKRKKEIQTIEKRVLFIQNAVKEVADFLEKADSVDSKEAYETRLTEIEATIPEWEIKRDRYIRKKQVKISKPRKPFKFCAETK